MLFKTLDPDTVRKLIIHDEDVLTPRATTRTMAIRAMSCPTCQGELEEVMDPYRPFSEGELLPKTLASCKKCDYLFDPSSGLTLKEGLIARPPQS